MRKSRSSRYGIGDSGANPFKAIREIATSPLLIVTAQNYSAWTLRRWARLTFPSARAWNFHVLPGPRSCTSSTAIPIPRPLASKSLKRILAVRTGARLTLVNVPTTLLRPGVTSRSTRNESTRMRCFKGTPAKAAGEANPKPSNNRGTAKRSFIRDFGHGTESRRLAHELQSVRYRPLSFQWPNYAFATQCASHEGLRVLFSEV